MQVIKVNSCPLLRATTKSLELSISFDSCLWKIGSLSQGCRWWLLSRSITFSRVLRHGRICSTMRLSRSKSSHRVSWFVSVFFSPCFPFTVLQVLTRTIQWSWTYQGADESRLFDSHYHPNMFKCRNTIFDSIWFLKEHSQLGAFSTGSHSCIQCSFQLTTWLGKDMAKMHLTHHIEGTLHYYPFGGTGNTNIVGLWLEEASNPFTADQEVGSPCLGA